MDWEGWIAEVEGARTAFATLLGTVPANIAVGTSVSQLVSSVASALATSEKIPFTRRRIVSSVADFPGVVHAWLALRAQGWQIELLEADERNCVGAERFYAALKQDTALLSVPHVGYTNGALLDLPALADAAHARGSLVFVDAYQSLGTIPLNVQASAVDFLAAGTLKYLCGTAGIAFLYVHPRVQEQLRPTVTGWFGRQNPFAFDPRQLDYAASASRFDLGTPPVLNAYAARSGIDLLLATGIELIRAQILRLSASASEHAARLGLTINGPLDVSARGATTAIETPSPGHAHQIEVDLRQRAMLVSARGHLVRLAPHGFTHEEEVLATLTAIAQLLKAT
ncbi:MAG TPA: aminotransferase class V-fold PLP-dependent enzyme [Ktedonobacteraceae bacterium]|nr:aminotransferase class V-fold PLP-dependent enzyme [Ktedonobacteraceae bacterium]